MSVALRLAEMIEAGHLPDHDPTIVFCAALLAPIYGHEVSPSTSGRSYALSHEKQKYGPDGGNQ